MQHVTVRRTVTVQTIITTTVELDLRVGDTEEDVLRAYHASDADPDEVETFVLQIAET